MSHLPANWALAPLSDIADVKLGKMLSRKAYEPSLVQLPYLRNENVRWGVVRTDDVRAMGFREAERERYSVRSGDLLVCEGGEPGRCAVYRGPSGQFMYQKALHRIRVPEGLVEPTFLQLAIDCAVRVRRSVARFAETTIAHLPLEKILDLEVSLAPVAEQRRIVAEIEKHFTRLDTAVAALKRVQANLRRYRAVVLKSACDGSIMGPNLGNRAVVELGTLVALLRNGYSGKPDAPAGTPILRISAVRPGSVDLTDRRYLSEPIDRLAEFEIETGDLLFTRYNGTRDLVGVCGLVRELGRERIVHPDKLIRAEVRADLADPAYLQIVLNAGLSREFLARRIRTTAGQSGISGGDLRQVPVPVPALYEQRRIVAEVERRLSVVEELEAVVDHSLKRAARLRQAILKRAFEGRLVPQDPNDEPASVLLERIRAEKAASAATAPKGKARRPAKPAAGRRRKPTVEAG